MKRFASILVLALLSSVAPSALSQTNDAAAAEALFEAGRDAMARGDLAAACKNFEDSNQLDPAIGTVFNLANCEEQRGRLASAWQLFTEVAQQLPDTDDRRAIALERADALKGRLPYLTLRFAPGVPGDARVTRDGMAIGAAGLGVPLPVDPGAHEIVVSASGRRDKAFQVSLALAERKELVVTAGDPLPAAPPGATAPLPPRTASDEPSGPPIVGYVLAGVGIVGIAVGAVTGVLALDRKATMNDDGCDPDGKTCRSQDGVDAASSGEILANTSTIAFAVGGVSLGVGAYLLFFTGDGGKNGGEPKRFGTARGVSLGGTF
jgi:hypothetical protein